jgi:hypothetical protein
VDPEQAAATNQRTNLRLLDGVQGQLARRLQPQVPAFRLAA